MFRVTPLRSLFAIHQRRYAQTSRVYQELWNFFPKTESTQIEPAIIPPYLQSDFSEAASENPTLRRVYIETYGCQMNHNDTEIVSGILKRSGGYSISKDVEEADIVLLMTCAIREKAEAKIWARLDALNGIERRRRGNMTVGILGCMAERLKTELMERKRNVDIVCGPDAYRDLPRLLERAFTGISGINVMLSADETYADIAPVRMDPTRRTAFVSIMRGCNNMCAFCIVPFTRGRERSRPIDSVVDELKRLSSEGVKEVTLLGQNVNSYCDDSVLDDVPRTPNDLLSRGFKTVYKPKVGGRRFTDLLDKVSLIDPEMRIRFTSPHPKDFPDDLLYLMKERPNICKQIHLPAQSGSSSVLESMRRGYSREAYLELVEHIRSILPNVSLSTDLISGFCGETESDHQDTLSLLRLVKFDMAYMFAYSMREKTMAHRRYQDDVTEEVKQRRLSEVISQFYSILTEKVKLSVGQDELVLVEGPSKKDKTFLSGRSDSGKMIVFPAVPIEKTGEFSKQIPRVGEYVQVKVTSTTGATPMALPTKFSSIAMFGANC